MLYVVASMEPELANLQREFEALEFATEKQKFLSSSTLSGLGQARAGAAMTGILRKAKRRPEAVLMLGVAGAVNPGMVSGDLILADSYAMDSEGHTAKRHSSQTPECWRQPRRRPLN